MQCTHSQWISRLMIALLLSIPTGQPVAITAQGTTRTVTTLANSGPGSLRQAVADAQNGDTITFAVTGTLLLAGEDISITTDDLTIQGPGANQLAISGAGTSRIFAVEGANQVRITGLTVRDGFDTTLAGGIFNSGNLTLQDVVVTNNTTGSDGGGIFNSGILTLQDSLVASNVITGTDFSPSLQEGAGIYNTGDEGEFGSSQGTLSIIDSQIIDNHNAGSSGGGIHSGGTLRIEGSSITGNRTGRYGGGIYSAGDLLTIADSRIRNNISGDYGGGIYKVRGVGEIDRSVIQGNQALGTGLAGGGGIWNERTLRMNASVISDNHTKGRGGGLRSSTYVNEEVVLVRATTIQNNTAVREGGGLSLSGNGSVQIVGSTLSNNQTSGDGGGILNEHAQVAVTNSTVSNNQADGRGGGIANIFVCDSLFARTVTSVLTTTSSTLYGNQAAQGGGIYQRPLDVAADEDDGCADDTITSSLTLVQSIVASNVVTETGSDCAGPVSSGGFNLLGDTSGCTLTGATAGNIVASPALGPLADNGGPTRTHQPLSGSPAIDAIPAATCATDTDQRGLTRPQAANCDIGAVEASDLPPADPGLALNFATGSPGSVFTLRGNNLPAGAPATLTINGAVISDTLTTDAAGNLLLLLDTTAADPGSYSVRLQIQPGLAQSLDLRAGFDLRPDAVPRAPEAGGAASQVPVPADIAGASGSIYLPLIQAR